MAKLGEICLINPKSCTLRDDTEVSFIPMTKVGEHGEFDASEIKNYSEVKKGFTNFQNGDILFAKITPCMENGKGAIAHNMKNGIGFGSTEFHVLRPDTDKMTSEWLYYLTTWKTFRKEAERNMTGSAGQKRVPKTFLENYVVNLPDIDTQKSENKILRKVDDLIFLRKQQLAKLDELVKARFVEMFGDPISNPFGFKVESLQEMLDDNAITYHLDGNHGSDYPRNEEFVESGVSYISANCIIDDNVNLQLAKHLMEERAAKLRKGIAQDEDVLFAHNATVGPVAILHTRETKVVLGTSLTAYRCNKQRILPSYLKAYMQSEGFVRQYTKDMKQTTRNQVPITAQRKYLFIVPPLSLQNRFASFVERVDQQKQTVQQSLEKLELMKKALMQEYFG